MPRSSASAYIPKLEGTDELQTPSAISGVHGAPTFPLPSRNSLEARRFYQGEALRGGWNIRRSTDRSEPQSYEWTALSRNKAAMLRRGQEQTPEEEIKDPFFFFEFLEKLELLGEL